MGGLRTAHSLIKREKGNEIMTTIKLGNRELTVQYGYKVTWKSGIIKKLVGLSRDNGGDEFDRVEEVMAILPELLLIGVQKHHENEFKYDYETGKGKDQMLDKVCDILDTYFDEEGADFEALLTQLQEELLENGFLASMFRKEVEKKK